MLDIKKFAVLAFFLLFVYLPYVHASTKCGKKNNGKSCPSGYCCHDGKCKEIYDDGEPNHKCFTDDECDPNYGFCWDTQTTTTKKTTTTTKKTSTTTQKTSTTTQKTTSTSSSGGEPTSTSSLTTDGKCGSNNGARCLDAQCCNGGSCVNMYDYSKATSYKRNVLLVLDVSSVNMSTDDISKLNSLLKDIGNQLNSDIEIPYITFSDSAVKFKQSNNVSVSRVTSSTSSFASGLDMAIQFFNKYGKKKNGNPNVVVLYSAGNVGSSSSFGSSFADAVSKANSLKDSGVTIYTLNVNDSANAGSSIASVGSTVNYNDINTVMELLSSDYTNVSVSSNGSIESYTKSTSGYYRTPDSEDYTVLYNDIIYNTLSSSKNSKCNVSSGCEADFGRCEGVVSTTTKKTTTTTTVKSTTTTTTTTKKTTTTTTTVKCTTTTTTTTTTSSSSTLTSDGKCGSSNGKKCLDAQCCSNGNCVGIYDYSETETYNQNVLLLLDISSVNMSEEEIEKLNDLLKSLGTQFNENIQIPYIYFADSAISGKSYNSENILTVKRASSSGANFAAALEKAIEFYGKYGYKKNKKQNNIVIYSAGNVAPTSIENSFAEAFTNAINAANTLKESGCNIYTLNVNKDAKSGSSVAAVGSTVNYNDINTVMELLSSDYSNVSVSSSGVINGYSKTSSNYYRTPGSEDYTALYTDILQATMTGAQNSKCSVDGGCEESVGECIVLTATQTTATTTSKPTSTVVLSSDGKCGSVNGAHCLDAQCCNNGSCVNMYDYTNTDTYNQNVLLLLDVSSVNMDNTQIDKLNELLANLGNQFNADIEIPYILFNDVANKYKSYNSEEILTVGSVTSTGANFAAALEMAIEFFNKYGEKKNGNPNNIVIYSAGNIVQTEEDGTFGVALANAVTAANTLKDSGVTIYTLNVNESAQAGSTIAVPGKSVSKRDINSVMELLSSDYTNVVVKTNGIVEEYTKSGTGYYRTPESNDYTALYTDILQATMTGVKSDKCEASSGCETGFGKCDGVIATTTVTITSTSTVPTATETSTPVRCGEAYGSCPSGYCCSKDGVCGKTNDFCFSNLGCQPQYGDCKCGDGKGTCNSSYCCSKKGYCGRTKAYCYSNLGCQIQYGQCKCGDGIGICDNALCCSKKGYCGKTAAYCYTSKGCQNDYGQCKCGADGIGNCAEGLCCSKKGYCGTTRSYCWASLGCQSEFGICNANN